MKLCLVISVVACSVLTVLSLPSGGLTELNCTNPNEYYDCGSACQTECATLDQFCPIVNIRCNDACYCIKGYARNAAGVCIPRSECKK